MYFISSIIKNGVFDDGVPAILHYRPSDLYLADSKETMMVEVGNFEKRYPHSSPYLQIRPPLDHVDVLWNAWASC